MKLASYIMEYMLLPPMARKGALIPLAAAVRYWSVRCHLYDDISTDVEKDTQQLIILTYVDVLNFSKYFQNISSEVSIPTLVLRM